MMSSHYYLFFLIFLLSYSFTLSVSLHRYATTHSNRFIHSSSILNTKVDSIVINSPVLDFAPWLELHHIVLLKDKTHSGIVCAIDFSPLNQTNPNTLSNLLLGKNVPAEIRINWITDFDGQINSIKSLAINSSKLSSNMLKRYRTPPKGADPVLIEFVNHIVEAWPSHMNFYNKNCQHFSGFVQSKLHK